MFELRKLEQSDREQFIKDNKSAYNAGIYDERIIISKL